LFFWDRVEPCGRDGVEQVAVTSRDASDGTWMHFDDEFVDVRVE